MKGAIAVALVLAVAALALNCQAPKEFMDKMDEQSKTMEELGRRIDALEAKLAETTTAFNELATKFDEHMEKHHKTKVTTPHIPPVAPPRRKK